MSQFEDKFNSISAILQGLIVSTILLTASLSSIAAGPLSDRISRTRTFALGGLVFGLGSILSSAAANLPMLLVGRCVTGLGEGLFMSTITVYVLEIAPASLRGRLSCLTQLFVTIGVASGKILHLTFTRNKSLKHRMHRLLRLLWERQTGVLYFLAHPFHSSSHRLFCILRWLPLPSSFSSMATTRRTSRGCQTCMGEARVYCS